MSKHTPGPWEWWTSNSLKRLSANQKDGSVLHAVRLRDGAADICVSEADMALIASAPELLATLIDLVEDVTHEDHEPRDWSVQACIRNATAAIAKARGEA